MRVFKGAWPIARSSSRVLWGTLVKGQKWAEENFSMIKINISEHTEPENKRMNVISAARYK